MLSFSACGGSNSGGGGGGGNNPPAAPSGLTATAGNAQVTLSWNASSGATSYHVKRGTASGGPYTTLSSPTTNSYTDTTASNGTPYYYVVSAVNTNGESGNSGQATATPVAPVSQACNQQLLNSFWTSSVGGTRHPLTRRTTSQGMYGPVTRRTADGKTQYETFAAVSAGEESVSASQISPEGSSTNVNVTVDVLKNRHMISAYIYGGAFPDDAASITDSALSVVRWGGNATSTYNWKLGTNNADNDWYFEDFAFGALNNSADSESTQFIKDVHTAGSNALMTMVMLPCVAQSPETSTQQGGASNNNHWSFPVTSWSSQCAFDPYNSNAGDGLMSDCTTQITAKPSDIINTYYPLLDGPPQAGDPANSVYRSQWAAALATAFGSGSCPIPYSTITSCHYYDMDNEVDIWGGTHIDVHPNPSGYDELANIYVTEATNLKVWDPAAVRLGPVSCCWWFYWNGANSNDKAAHAGDDFLPWWLNQVYFKDQVAGKRSLDLFDIHAYPDGPDTTNYTTAQKRAAAVSIYRDYWDPTLTSPSGTVNQPWATSIQPNHTIAFRIPRMRAIVNSTYPGTPLAMTEWSAEFAGASDFSTALGDADAYGVLGRERVSLATRWTAPSSSNPNYQALKLYTNYDGAHHGFGTTSVSATHDADPSLFSTYAALNSGGTVMTIMVLNKDPANSAQVTFTIPGFTPSTVTSYTLSQSSPTSIVAGTSQAWSATRTFAAYTATLLVVNGTLASSPAAEWDLNPDTIMVPANGTVTLSPKITSATGSVTLANAVFDAYEGASACSGSLNITTAAVTTGANGEITVNAGNTPAFCHFTVIATDSASVTQSQGGWIVVGNPAATFTTAGDHGSGSPGSQLVLSVTLSPGSSGGTKTGASVLFSTTGGSLANGTNSGGKVIAVTNSSGIASVTLTLPGTAGPVTVTAEGPFGLGHPVATFTETAQ